MNSMPAVDFYLLSADQHPACYPLTCRLANEAYQQKQFVYIHSLNPVEAVLLDDLLWTFRDISFIPHGLEGTQADQPKAPVRIGFGQQLTPPYGLLINLTAMIPDFFAEFDRVIEFVLQEEAAKVSARQKYSLYRKAGCKLNTHDLNKGQCALSGLSKDE